MATPASKASPVAAQKEDISDYGSHDHGFDEDRVAPGSNHKEFSYMVLSGGRFIYASAARLVLLQFMASMTPSADVLALANAEVDISAVEVGQGITVKWRGKPIFIRRRTEHEIEEMAAVPMHALRDEEADEDRVLQPEWLVLVGICTHLGCVPMGNAGEFHGWFCPCHGSHYDLSGRIRKGPAPLNMEIPPYKFMEPTKLLIG
jgi:ubiquinol-cytochrome c reductase iron-sulfur subunit